MLQAVKRHIDAYIYTPYREKKLFKVGLRMSTQASVDESILTSTRVYFKYSVTREVLYYRPRNEMFCVKYAAFHMLHFSISVT